MAVDGYVSVSRELRVNCVAHPSLHKKFRSIRNESQLFGEPLIFLESSNSKLCSCHVELNTSSGFLDIKGAYRTAVLANLAGGV